MGWQEVKKRRGSKYDVIREKSVAAIRIYRKKDGAVESRNIVLTPVIGKLLGNPEKVLVYRDGAKVGLKASKNGEGYALDDGAHSGATMLRITCSPVIKDLRLKDGSVFDVTMDGDMLVFDTRKPLKDISL